MTESPEATLHRIGVHEVHPRDDLLLEAWQNRQLPDRDFLLGSTICTTSRWLIFGDTGIGKTLFAMSMGGAMSAGLPFLNWIGRRKARVMYLDGELPAETFKERMQLVAKSCGVDVAFYGYNREVLGPDDMPPLNTEAGQKWLFAEINLIQPDVIFGDAIMSLLIGSMSEEESWAPMKPLVRALSARRIAQVWLHHTGHDSGRSFGTKTREWEMDTVLAATKEEDSRDAALLLEFRKARLRTPETAEQFTARTVRFLDGEWISDSVAAPAPKGKQTEVDAIRIAILAAYDRLADGCAPAVGFNGAKVRKVHVDELRAEVRDRGFLDKNDKGAITATARSNFRHAKVKLIAAGKLIESEDLIWRP
ncbi:AAA domain-containing protein [Rhizobiales bacterium GAS191]|nr:AAA domain-containing protein [Rhizobiales bacterium GAS191]